MKSFKEHLKNEKNLGELAENHFGVTDNPKEAGYIMPNGKMLDLSGRHQVPHDYKQNPETLKWEMKPGKGRDYLSNKRSTDHRDFPDEIYDKLKGQGPTDKMHDFMKKTGAIRFHPGTGFHVTTKPTLKQLGTAIIAHRRISSEPLYLDIGKNNEDSREFHKPNLNNVGGYIESKIGIKR